MRTGHRPSKNVTVSFTLVSSRRRTGGKGRRGTQRRTREWVSSPRCLARGCEGRRVALQRLPSWGSRVGCSLQRHGFAPGCHCHGCLCSRCALQPQNTPDLRMRSRSPSRSPRPADLVHVQALSHLLPSELPHASSAAATAPPCVPPPHHVPPF